MHASELLVNKEKESSGQYCLFSCTEMGLTFLVLRDLSSTADKTGTAGSDKTDLLTGRGITSDSRWVTLKKSIYQSYYMRH